MQRSLPKKALFSSFSAHLTQKTMTWVYTVLLERDFTASRHPRSLAVADGTRVMLEKCMAASKSMHEMRVSRKRGKTLNVNYPTNLTRFFILSRAFIYH